MAGVAHGGLSLTGHNITADGLNAPKIYVAWHSRFDVRDPQQGT
jgi:hypothetical protein